MTPRQTAHLGLNRVSPQQAPVFALAENLLHVHSQQSERTGRPIGEISGKNTMQRVLPSLGGYPKIETSFQATGSMLGTNVNDTGTYAPFCVQTALSTAKAKA